MSPKTSRDPLSHVVNLRRKEYELAGAVAFGSLPGAFGALAGWGGAAPPALAGVVLVRSVPTVLTVRANLRLKIGQAVSILPGLSAAGAGLVLSAWLVSLRLAPWTAAFFAAVFAARTIWLLCWRPRLAARTIGVAEATLGGLKVLALAIPWNIFNTR